MSKSNPLESELSQCNSDYILTTFYADKI